MSERYQREIEEILQQVGESTPAKELRKARKLPLLGSLSRTGRGIASHLYLTSRRLTTIGILLLLSAVLVSATFPGLLGPFAWLGLILFILVYALFFAHPGLKAERRWRGRSAEPQSGAGRREGLWDIFQRWLKR